MAKNEDLQIEIDERSRQIHTDAYPMSIGEVVGMYQSKELEIHPEFQRFFRWSPEQKHRLIESIMLGIPIPTIFVSQRDDGVWDVVDGLQRLSTIFEFMGVLTGEDNQVKPPLQLGRTRYLHALDGMSWRNEVDPDLGLTTAQQLDFKRAKLSFVIIKRQSDAQAKYDLFQRLNTGGSQLSDQELRNCMLISVNRDFYVQLCNLAGRASFQQCVPLTDRQIEEQYALELVLRFIVLRRASAQQLQDIDVGEYLTESMMELAQDTAFDLEEASQAFERTFHLLAASTGEDSFRRWDSGRERSLGAFSLSAFEVIAVGIGSNCQGGAYRGSEDRLVTNIRSIWTNNDYLSRSGSGARASWRLPYLIPLGRRLFGDGNQDV